MRIICSKIVTLLKQNVTVITLRKQLNKCNYYTFTCKGINIFNNYM